MSQARPSASVFSKASMQLPLTGRVGESDDKRINAVGWAD